jgi:hypothetical protein
VSLPSVDDRTSGHGAERNCRHGSLPAAIRGIPENIFLVASLSQADPRRTHKLQLVAKPQLAAYVWRELINNRRPPAPKLAGADIRSRQDFVADEVAQNLCYPDFVNFS